MPFTTNKGLSVQTAGTNNGIWGAGFTGSDLNTGVIGPLDSMVAGVSSFSVASTNVSLQTADVQNCMYRFTGTLTASITVAPASSAVGTYFNGFYYYENLTSTANSSTITVTNFSASSSLALPINTRGAFFIDATNGLRMVSCVGYNNPLIIPLSTVTCFYQSATPAGWTQVTTAGLGQSAMQIVIDSSGGTTGGSIAFPTVFGRTATDSYTLLITDIPAHTHNIAYPGNTQFNVNTGLNGVEGPLGSGGASAATTPTGGGGGHTHPINLQVQYSNWMVASYAG